MRHGNCDATSCKPGIGNCFSLPIVKTVRYHEYGKLVSLNNPVPYVFGHSATSASYVPEDKGAQVGADYTCGQIHLYMEGSPVEPKTPNTLECDGSQQDHLTSRVVAQHYSSATLV